MASSNFDSATCQFETDMAVAIVSQAQFAADVPREFRSLIQTDAEPGARRYGPSEQQMDDSGIDGHAVVVHTTAWPAVPYDELKCNVPRGVGRDFVAGIGDEIIDDAIETFGRQ